MTDNRRTSEEIMTDLRSGEYHKSVSGWVIFDNVDGEWQFMATSSGEALPPQTGNYWYEPTFESVNSTVKNGYLRLAGMKLVHQKATDAAANGFLFFAPVGKIHFYDNS